MLTVAICGWKDNEWFNFVACFLQWNVVEMSMHYYIQISNHITGLKKKIQKSSNLSNIDFCLSFMSHMQSCNLFPQFYLSSICPCHYSIQSSLISETQALVFPTDLLKSRHFLLVKEPYLSLLLHSSPIRPLHIVTVHTQVLEKSAPDTFTPPKLGILRFRSSECIFSLPSL